MAILFEDGDRVESKNFGFGTVIEISGACYSGDLRTGKEVKETAYAVKVRWDDPARDEMSILSTALTKISSPDARPFTYWNKKWQPLYQSWLHARRELELAYSSFRPLPNPLTINIARQAEKEALAKLEDFLAQEKSGAHS